MSLDVCTNFCLARRRVASRRRCSCRLAQIGATFRFRDEETSRSRATFASPREYRALPVCRTNVQSIIGRASSLQPRLHRIYRVAVEFTSRRISKDSKIRVSLLPGVIIFSRGDYALTFDGRMSILKASFSIKECSDDRYLWLVCHK